MKLFETFAYAIPLSMLGSVATMAVEVPECDEKVAITTTNSEPYIYFDGGGLRTQKTVISIFDDEGTAAGSVTIQLETVQGQTMPGCYYTPAENAQRYCREDDDNPNAVDGSLRADFENNLVCY